MCQLPLNAEMNCFPHELSTPVADNKYVKNICVKNPFAYAENVDCSRVKYPTDVKSAGFRSRLEASRGSRYTEESSYNEPVCL